MKAYIQILLLNFWLSAGCLSTCNKLCYVLLKLLVDNYCSNLHFCRSFSNRLHSFLYISFEVVQFSVWINNFLSTVVTITLFFIRSAYDFLCSGLQVFSHGHNVRKAWCLKDNCFLKLSEFERLSVCQFFDWHTPFLVCHDSALPFSTGLITRWT